MGASAKKNREEKFICRMHPRIRCPDVDPNLPARLGYARDEPLRGQLAEREPRNLEPPNEGTPAPGDFAAVYHSHRAGIAWQLRETGVILFRLQLSAQSSVFLHRRAF